MQVYVLQIDHKHGTSISAFTTEQLAEHWVADFCREWWDHENVEGNPPDNDSECITQYFNHIDGRESWEIHTCTLDEGYVHA